MCDVTILSALGASLPWLAEKESRVPVVTTRDEVEIGGYCKGECVAECTALFGEMLWDACRTCPN